MGHPASVPSHEPGRFPSPGPEPHGSALHGSALDGSVEAPTVSRLLYFSGAGLTVVHLLLFGLIVQAVFDAVDDPRRANLVISVTTQMEHVITACLMIAGVLLYRTAPIRRRLIATGIVVLFPVLSVGVHFLQGVISSSLGLAPGAASTTLILIAAAASTFAQVLCLLTAWNVVAGRPMSVHIIALCGAVGLTLLQVILQVVPLFQPAVGTPLTAQTVAAFGLMLCGMATLFYVSWKRRHAIR